MKSKAIKLIVLVGICVAIGMYLYQGIAVLFRYSSPEESFRKSAPWGAKLIDILEDKDVAYVMYEKDNGSSVVSTLIGKDSNGWFPLLEDTWHTKIISQNDVHIRVYEEYGKHILIIEIFQQTGKALPQIQDSLNSNVEVCKVYSDGEVELFAGLIVSESLFPDDYQIICGEEAINFA